MAWSSMTILLLNIGFICVSTVYSQETFTVDLKKILRNGDPAPITVPIDFSVQKDGNINVKFTADITDFNLLDATVYFANETKTILQIQFSDGIIKPTLYETPYLKSESVLSEINDDKVQVSKGYVDANVPLNWLPKGTTAVSASMIIVPKGMDKTILLNYYGIKNYMIAIDDTQIVESYQPVDLLQWTK